MTRRISRCSTSPGLAAGIGVVLGACVPTPTIPSGQPVSTPAAVCALDTNGPPAREINPSACVDPDSRRKLGGRLDAPLEIGLDVLVTRRMGTAVADRARVDADVAQVNAVFASGDIAFFVNSFGETDAIAADVDNSVSSNAFFHISEGERTLKVLYVGSYASGGGVAWYDGSGVVIDAVAGAHAILAHELGHAVGLLHTYAPDDLVNDTNFDPWTCELGSECFSGACEACRYTSCPAPYDQAMPDPRNVMAPAVHPTTRRSQACNLQVTEGQWELIHCTLRTGQKRLLPPAPVCPPCGIGFRCENGRCVCDKTLCGDRCVALGTNTNCSACGDKCGPGQRCFGEDQGCVDVGPCPGARDCGLDCFGNQVCVPLEKPGGCPVFKCPD